LVDENQFLVSYPRTKDGRELKKTRSKFSDDALTTTK